jgi:hypothetical protein
MSTRPPTPCQSLRSPQVPQRFFIATVGPFPALLQDGWMDRWMDG